MDENDKSYTVKEVSDLLNVHYTKVYKLIESKELEAFDISTLKNTPGNHRPNWRISNSSLARFMEARKYGR